jgi:hypothetical protein
VAAVGWPLRKRPSIDERRPLAEAVVDHLELAKLPSEEGRADAAAWDAERKEVASALPGTARLRSPKLTAASAAGAQ